MKKWRRVLNDKTVPELSMAKKHALNEYFCMVANINYSIRLATAQPIIFLISALDYCSKVRSYEQTFAVQKEAQRTIPRFAQYVFQLLPIIEFKFRPQPSNQYPTHSFKPLLVFYYSAFLSPVIQGPVQVNANFFKAIETSHRFLSFGVSPWMRLAISALPSMTSKPIVGVDMYCISFVMPHGPSHDLTVLYKPDCVICWCWMVVQNDKKL